MQNDAATLQCPNDACKAENCQPDKFCQLCGSPLIKRYLWAVGEEMPAYQIGNLIADRYLVKSNRILLDTKPSLSPETPFLEISNAIKPYLRLVPYRLQVPQVYDLVPQELGRNAKEVLLLEQAPIYTDAVLLEGQLMPELTSAWKEATSMQQMNWLWQTAQLWQPLSTEGVTSSLLDLQLLRVEGSLIRLLQLQPDQGTIPTLSQLGQLWSQLVSSARPSVAEFIAQLCHSLSEGEIQSAEKLIAVLDQGLTEVGRSQALTLTISTYTDIGPSRQCNEDACYPASGTTTTVEATSSRSLAIVCDGIGGHEGGNIASNLAIEIIQQQIQQMPLGDVLDPTTISNKLEHATRLANDQISQRNDHEQRHGRQRMGTTLVMSLARAHEIYITHVGDSRAYWITRTGCHQVTLDDDVAAREVRLGYAIYRDALQQASSGSLIQALGMTSAALHPTIQRFIIDEDCVFLLCSDGLSDYERVEQFWEEILPILDGKVDVATASQRLVEIGNTQNGHDNVTVGLVHCQVKFSEPEVTLNPSLAVVNLSGVLDPVVASVGPVNATSKFNPQLLPSQTAPVSRFLPILLGLVLLVSLGSGLITFLAKSKRGTISSSVDAQLSRSSVSPTEPQSFSAVSSLGKGALIRIKSEIVLNRTASRPDAAIAQPQQRISWGIFPVGSVLQVVDKQLISAQDYWLNLKVCSTPNMQQAGGTKLQSTKNDIVLKTGNIKSYTTTSKSMSTTNLRMLQPKDKMWIRETEIDQYYLTVASLEPAGQINCPPLTDRRVGDKE